MRRRQSDDTAIDERYPRTLQHLRYMQGPLRRDSVGIDIDPLERLRQHLSGHRFRGVGRANADDDLSHAAKLLQGSDLLETVLLGPLPGLFAPIRRYPVNVMATILNCSCH